MVKIHPWKDIFLQVIPQLQHLSSQQLQGILGSDLAAFQSEDYLLNFLDCCERGLGTR